MTGRRVTVLLLLLLVASVGAPRLATASGNGRGKLAAMGVTPAGSPPVLGTVDFDRMVAMGLNHVAIDVWWDFDTATASLVHPGEITSPDAELAATMDAAREHHLAVVFTPKLWCLLCQPLDGYTWRGRLKPANPAAFFASYRQMVEHYADLARQHGVDLFFIGSELSETQGFTDQWRALAKDVRTHFPGRIAYEVNWDVFDRVGFWDAVDVAGLSAYFPLDDAAHPSAAELKDAWHDSRNPKWLHHDWVQNVRDLARMSKKPVLFGELGYPSAAYGAKAPFDPSVAGAPDMAVQANAYQAALETFQDEPYWMGVIWWEWYVTSGGANDNSYSPRDKTAEKVLTRWYTG